LDRIDYRQLDVEHSMRDLVREAPPEYRPKPVLPPASNEELLAAVTERLPVGRPERLFYVGDAMRLGMSEQRVHELTAIDPWFIAQFKRILDHEKRLREATVLDRELLLEAKQLGFGDEQIASLRGETQDAVRARRKELGVKAVFS